MTIVVCVGVCVAALVVLLGLPEHIFLHNKVLPLLPALPQYTAEGPDEGREVVGEGKLLEGGGEVGEKTQCKHQPVEEGHGLLLAGIVYYTIFFPRGMQLLLVTMTSG